MKIENNCVKVTLADNIRIKEHFGRFYCTCLCLQRKQNKLTSLQKKPGEENQPEENIFLERLKELHQSSHDIKENRMVSEVLKCSIKCMDKLIIDLTVTSYTTVFQLLNSQHTVRVYVYSFCHIVRLLVHAAGSLSTLRQTIVSIRQWHWSRVYMSPCSLAQVLG